MIHIIDDEATLRKLISELLSISNFQSRTFPSGEHYLAYMNSPDYSPPLVVLSDVTMPGIDGYALVQKIRERLPLQKIILVTGNACDEQHKRAARQLCYSLDKPFSPDHLLELIDAIHHCDSAHRQGQPYGQQCTYKPARTCPFYQQQQ